MLKVYLLAALRVIINVLISVDLSVTLIGTRVEIPLMSIASGLSDFLTAVS